MEGCDTITEIERNCMRCKEVVSIDFQEIMSQSEKPILIGKCPECDGVNIQRLPCKTSQKESSEVENPGEDVEISENISELSKVNPDNCLESSDNPSEESENSPSQVSPSDSSVQTSDIVQAYDQGYGDGREDMSSDITKESEDSDQDIPSPEGESDQIVEMDQDSAQESEKESGTSEKLSGIHIFMMILTIVSLASIGIMAYLEYVSRE